MQRSYNDSFGTIRIGQCSSVDTTNFTCDLTFVGTYSSATQVPLAPHPMMGMMPSAGDLVAIYDHPGYGKRVLFPLYESEDLTVSQLQDRPTQSGLVPNLNEGEVYIGRYGRALFDNQGNAYIQSQAARSGLNLKYDSSVSELYGQNLDIHTSGNNVRIHSSSSIPAIWGDSLSLEVNIPIAPGIDSAPEVIPSNLGRLVIGNTGSVDIDVLPLSLSPLSLQVNSVGYISMGRLSGPITPISRPPLLAGLTIDIFNTINLTNPLGGLSIPGSLAVSLGNVSLRSAVANSSLNLLADGSIDIKNSSGFFRIDSDGSMLMSNSSIGLDLGSDGSMSMIPSSLLWSLGINPSGDYAFAGKNVDISAAAAASISAVVASLTGSVSVNLAAPIISLGLVPAGHAAIVEALVLIFQQLAVFNTKIENHTHAIQGAVITGLGSGGSVTGIASPSLELAGFAPIPPVASAIGSQTVTVQA